MEQVLKSLTLDYFGNGKHKISPEKFFDMEQGLLLDVRSKEESDSISIKLEHHSNVESYKYSKHNKSFKRDWAKIAPNP